MGGIVVYGLSVAGGILAIAPMPGKDGDYAGDLQHLRDWTPALVISMTTQYELDQHGAGDIGNDLQDAGARWIHLPVQDLGIPDVTQNETWHMASKVALGALQGGGRVLIHCKGGCGRSGMAALRLMLEAGENFKPALARLRGVRPCAVETDAQLEWAQQG